MFSSKKRDRMEIIAAILCSCKTPQTRTYIRRQTCIPYSVLQNCIVQLILLQWIEPFEQDSGPAKIVITEKGLIFLEKWFEIQNIIGGKSKHKNRVINKPLMHLI